MEGESAPILWYKYRRGDKTALKELVTYNHADIEGMKLIFDYAIEKIYEINNIPNKIRLKIFRRIFPVILHQSSLDKKT